MNEKTKLVSMKTATREELQNTSNFYENAQLVGVENRYTGKINYALRINLSPVLTLEFGAGYRTVIDGQKRVVGLLEKEDIILLALDRNIPLEKVENGFNIKLGCYVRFITGEANYQNADGTAASFIKAECRLSHSVVTSIFLTRKQIELVKRLKLDLKMNVVEKEADSIDSEEIYNDDVIVDKVEKKKKVEA